MELLVWRGMLTSASNRKRSAEKEVLFFWHQIDQNVKPYICITSAGTRPSDERRLCQWQSQIPQ
jgi:hypothetical protein